MLAKTAVRPASLAANGLVSFTVIHPEKYSQIQSQGFTMRKQVCKNNFTFEPAGSKIILPVRR